ncbi:F-box and associated interaction domains-containing protein [Prunus dulcis]|uniref:F-box and associated interaction domains-containing protein n=1 Tax=Prunus dulcis TaxID=3755 RepID=A0A4Y1RCX0_PRUDU|nr:F-box and associated interaction domains-containing protein [Prunus dulcis]
MNLSFVSTAFRSWYNYVNVLDMDNTQDITQAMQEFKFEAFPQEIIRDILFRLPVKSLINCTSVCTAWRSMIMNKSFIRAHLTLTVDFANQDDIDLLLLHIISCDSSSTFGHKTIVSEIKDEVHCVHYDNQAFDVYSKIEFPIAPKQELCNSHLRVVGTCSGLICLADDILHYGYNFFIWNPAIRKLVTLPRPGVTFRTHGGYDASIGFGFDAMTNDYKVVRFVALQHEDERPTAAEVYSLATGTWRSLGCVSPACGTNGAASNAFVNGVLHWPVVSDGDGCYFILTFDLGKEVFEYGRKESWTKLITLGPGPQDFYPGPYVLATAGKEPPLTRQERCRVLLRERTVIVFLASVARTQLVTKVNLALMENIKLICSAVTHLPEVPDA